MSDKFQKMHLYYPPAGKDFRAESIQSAVRVLEVRGDGTLKVQHRASRKVFDVTPEKSSTGCQCFQLPYGLHLNYLASCELLPGYALDTWMFFSVIVCQARGQLSGRLIRVWDRLVSGSRDLV